MSRKSMLASGTFVEIHLPAFFMRLSLNSLCNPVFVCIIPCTAYITHMLSDSFNRTDLYSPHQLSAVVHACTLRLTHDVDGSLLSIGSR